VVGGSFDRSGECTRCQLRGGDDSASRESMSRASIVGMRSVRGGIFDLTSAAANSHCKILEAECFRHHLKSVLETVDHEHLSILRYTDDRTDEQTTNLPNEQTKVVCSIPPTLLNQ